MICRDWRAQNTLRQHRLEAERRAANRLFYGALGICFILWSLLAITFIGGM